MKENLYHFTTINNLIKILKNGLRFTNNDLYPDLNYFFTISTTRKHELLWHNKKTGEDDRTRGHNTTLNQFEERICFNPKNVNTDYFLSPKYFKRIDILSSNANYYFDNNLEGYNKYSVDINMFIIT